MFPSKKLQRLQTQLSKQDGNKRRPPHTTDDLQILLIHLQKLQARTSPIGSSCSRTAANSTVHPLPNLTPKHVKQLSLSLTQDVLHERVSSVHAVDYVEIACGLTLGQRWQICRKNA